MSSSKKAIFPERKKFYPSPCACRTRKRKQNRKFYSKVALVKHLDEDHNNEFDIKIMYRKRQEGILKPKKRGHEEFENDGFVEIEVEEIEEGEEDDEDEDFAEFRQSFGKMSHEDKSDTNNEKLDTNNDKK
jgi:hypothetical protein